MKLNKKYGFTLAELVVVLSVIGVLATIMLTSFGNKVDRNKALFKKAYSLTERTVVELVNDETYYPYDFKNFGFAELSNVEILGTNKCTDNSAPTCKVKKLNNSNQKKAWKLEKFVRLFSNNLNTTGQLKKADDNKWTFSTTDAIEWSVFNYSGTAVPEMSSGFIIKIDTNGSKEPNKPGNVGKIASDQAVKNRDSFFMYIRDDGKMFLHPKDETAKGYLQSGNLNKDDK